MATKWEYKKASVARNAAQGGRFSEAIEEDWLKALNDLGAQGWELIGERIDKSPQGTSISGTFKRPL